MHSRSGFKTRIGDWIFKSTFPEIAPVKLIQRRIFILPTKLGLMLGITLILMLIGSINYNLSLGYVLTFLAASSAVVSILHTFRNLVRLELTPGKTEPVFAGEETRFVVSINNSTILDRYSVALRYQTHEPVYVDLPGQKNTIVYLPVTANKRGWLIIKRINVFTQYPMGLFNAWSNVNFDLRCLVYPKPDYTQHLPEPGTAPYTENNQHGIGTDDFAGLRQHQPSDSPKHIAWKTVAREQGMMTKQFTGESSHELWLGWEQLQSLETESRLSCLCGWILRAEAANLRYGLRLPGLSIAPNAGNAHKNKCLEALALFGQSAE